MQVLLWVVPSLLSFPGLAGGLLLETYIIVLVGLRYEQGMPACNGAVLLTLLLLCSGSLCAGWLLPCILLREGAAQSKCTLGSSLMLSICFLLPVSLEEGDDEMVPLISSQGAIRKFGKAVC